MTIVSAHFLDLHSLFLDIDECKEEKDDCPDDATCVNIPKSFTCKCKAGYHFDSNKRKCKGEDLWSNNKTNVDCLMLTLNRPGRGGGG